MLQGCDGNDDAFLLPNLSAQPKNGKKWAKQDQEQDQKAREQQQHEREAGDDDSDDESERARERKRQYEVFYLDNFVHKFGVEDAMFGGGTGDGIIKTLHKIILACGERLEGNCLCNLQVNYNTKGKAPNLSDLASCRDARGGKQ